MQNVIIKGIGNPAVFVFSFSGTMAHDGLNNFAGITVKVGSETYTLDDHVSIADKNTLELDIGAVTALSVGSYYPEIIGTSAKYPSGFLLSGAAKRILSGSISIVNQ